MASVPRFIAWKGLLLVILSRKVDSSLRRHANGAHHFQTVKEVSNHSSHETIAFRNTVPYMKIHTFGAGFAVQGTADEGDHWDMEYFFHCGNKHFHGPLVLSQALLILAILALIVGLTGGGYEYMYGAEPSGSWGPWMDKTMFFCSVYGGVLVYCYDLLSDTMVIIGFGYCGYWWWMAFSIAILIGAQIYAAYEFSLEEKTVGERIKMFIIAICQGHVFYNARESWKQGQVTAHFARHKFIEAVWEAGPQAVFLVYVLYYLDQRDNFWLVASVFGSICGLAWGISMWLDFSFCKQLEEDGISASQFQIRWYHHCLWGAYFVVDFSLRLLTIGLFLSLHHLRPYNQVVFFVLVVVYLLAVMISTQVYHTEAGQETWEIFPGETVQVRRAVIAQRCIDGLILTFFVHVLPADIRLAPKHHEESRLLFALHPDLRHRLMKLIIPLRAADYLGLGIASMYFKWDEWQCAALVSLFIIMHLLLILVLRAQRPIALDRQRSAPNLEDLPPDIQRRLSQMDSQPFLTREQSSVARRSNDEQRPKN